jgi:hypothetical protein
LQIIDSEGSKQQSPHSTPSASLSGSRLAIAASRGESGEGNQRRGKGCGIEDEYWKRKRKSSFKGEAKSNLLNPKTGISDCFLMDSLNLKAKNEQQEYRHKITRMECTKWQKRATAKGGTIHLFSISIMGKFLARTRTRARGNMFVFLWERSRKEMDGGRWRGCW